MTTTYRQPTGKPSWPIVLLAGAEKAGKTYAAAEASASPHIGRTLWVSVGEDDPDEYGAIPGARFEIANHDGTYRGILAALTDAAALPAEDGKPNLVVIDSATRLWDLLTDMAQEEANRRARIKAQKYGKPAPDEDARPTMDLWNTAKQRWQHVMDVLRSHDGPTLVIARMESVVVMDDRGEPTKDRTLKIKAEKSLPYDVGAVVEMRALGDTYLTGVRSLKFKPDPDGKATPYPDFTVDRLWTDLGVTVPGDVTPRHHAANDAMGEQRDMAAAEERDRLLPELAVLCDRKGWSREDVNARWVEDHGHPLRVTTDVAALRELMGRLSAADDVKEVRS